MTEPNYADDAARGTAACIREDVEAATDPVQAAEDYVQWQALDVNYLITSSGDVREVQLVVGVGGPHVEVHCWIGSEHVTVRAWSGRDRAEVEVHAPALAAEVEIMAEHWRDVTVTAVRS
jgi:hypothetical protein